MQINIFYEAEQKYIDSARKKAVELLLRRKDKGITIEDVENVCPRPYGVSKKVNAKVFKNDVFRPLGYTRARHTAANGHVIRLWCLNPAFFPTDEEA